jgi:6-phosphogluconate dehydrogenase
MVHNGIEYADMQLIAEAYDLLKNAVGLSNDGLAQTFREWNQGDLDSFLIQITAQIFRTKDPDTGDALVDRILDKAEQKGTGKWTSQSALDLGLPVTAITEAVFARFLSALKDQRVQAARLLPGPIGRFQGEQDAFVNAIREALYAAKVVAYAQGFEQMLAAGQEHGWDLHPGDIASIWRGGCIIRARFLNRIKEAFDDEPQLPNLLLAPYFREVMGSAQESWRRVVVEATRLGIPIPALSSALAYYDGYRRAHLPANLIQAQRDLFGAHTFERLDKPGVFHFRWTPAGA